MAKKMKEAAEVLQGTAWIGVSIGIYLGIRLLKQWKQRKNNSLMIVLLMGLALFWLPGNEAVANAAESAGTIYMERTDSTASVCREHLEIYLKITDYLSGIKNIRLWQNHILILDERISPEYTDEGEIQRITEWERTVRLLIETEGAVEIQAEMQDMAGNVSRKVQYWEADFTGPVATAGWRGAQNQGYFLGNGSLILHAKEKNFSPNDCQLQWKEYPDSFQKGVTWTQTGADEYVAEIPFTQDGTYEVEISGTDVVGNALTVENQGAIGRFRWKVDGTKPEIIVEGVEDGGIYNDTLQVKIRLSDNNLEQNQEQVNLVGNKNGRIELEQQDGMQYVWEPSMDIKMDDAYYLHIQAVDQAGNISEKEIHFWINRSGSQYELEGLEEDGSYTGKRQIVLEESNLNQVENYTLMYVWDGETRILEEGTDYIRSVRQEDSGMHYQYVLDTGLFTRAGQYTVTLLTEDEAGNKSSNLQNAYHNFAINFKVENPVEELSQKLKGDTSVKTAGIMENGVTGFVKKWIYSMCLVMYLIRKSACILGFPVV
ncbi:MAG: hypothetical protein ACI4EH_02590 [Oliverpabstia sp.]